jgi:glycerol-3-phosphate acyltransferase PlsY
MMILALLAGYAAGSIPFAWLVARAWGGIDIRRHGSGNPGATNVWRVLGPGPGAAALLLDAAKGYVPVAWALGASEAAGVAAAVGAVAGHAFPVFLGLRGGKGVATGAGAFLALAPAETALAAAGFGIVFGATGVVSAGSIAAAATLGVTAAVRRGLDPTPVAVAAGALAALVIARHAPNIRRLLDGTEAPAGPAWLMWRRPEAAAPTWAPLRVLLVYLIGAAAAAAWALLR